MKKQVLSAALLAIASANKEGFTVSAETLQPITKGYAVAVLDTQNSFGNEGLARVIDYVENHQNVAAFGGWCDTETDLYYWDATLIFDNMADAIEAGKVNKQIAIFDLENLTEIRL